MFELLPCAHSGRTIQTTDAFNCLNMAKKGELVVTVEFKNQGSNSIAIIEFMGGEITLASGSKGEGASWSPFIATGTYCETNFKVRFEAAGAGASTDKLQVVYSTIVKRK